MRKSKITQEFCLSLDLAKRSAQAAVAPMNAPAGGMKKFATLAIGHPPESPEAIRRLLEWVADVTAPGTLCQRVVVESTGKISARFARALAATKRFPPVHVVNPARSKSFLVSLGARDKTDALDAAGLALYGARCDLGEPRQPSRAEEKLRELNRLREAYVEQRTAWKSRLADACDPGARRRIEKSVAQTEKDICDMDKEIEKALQADAVLSEQAKSLKRITGVKTVVAATLTAELGDLRRYTRSEIVARAGLYPRKHESGQSVWRPPRLARGGGGRVRRVLYMAATSLFRSKGPLRRHIDEKIKAGARRMQVVGALMRKLLLIARAVVVSGGNYRPELIGRRQTAGQGGAQMM